MKTRQNNDESDGKLFGKMRRSKIEMDMGGAPLTNRIFERKNVNHSKSRHHLWSIQALSRRIFPKHGTETWTKKGTTQRASQMQMTCSKRRRRLDDPSAIGSACWTIFLPGFWNTFSVIWILLPWCKGANRGILLHSWQDSLWSRIDFGTLDARYTAQITDPQRATLLRNCRALEHCQVLKLSGCTPWRERGSNHWEDRDLVLDKSVGVGQIEMDLESQSCHAWRQMSFRRVLRTLHGGFPWLHAPSVQCQKRFRVIRQPRGGLASCAFQIIW